jgi:hypothetical protein
MSLWSNLITPSHPLLYPLISYRLYLAYIWIQIRDPRMSRTLVYILLIQTFKWYCKLMVASCSSYFIHHANYFYHFSIRSSSCKSKCTLMCMCSQQNKNQCSCHVKAQLSFYIILVWTTAILHGKAKFCTTAPSFEALLHGSVQDLEDAQQFC